MLIHPEFNPVAIHLGPLAIHWYGVMYIFGFIGSMLICHWRLNLSHIKTQGWVVNDIDQILFYVLPGVILGGRLGYVIFYRPNWFFLYPFEILKLWKGGMSFHGGFIGVSLAIIIYAKSHKRNLLRVTDFIIPAVPFGIAAGRLGNFINGELWGRVTSPKLPWAMGFPSASFDDLQWLIANLKQAINSNIFNLYQIHHGMIPRHPSQLYEMIFEGLVLLLILLLYSYKNKPLGAVTGLFIATYGIFRFIIEFTREPDNFLGLLAFNLSMGQWLSIPMIISGLILLKYSYKNHR